jgi:hypothetical protein
MDVALAGPRAFRPGEEDPWDRYRKPGAYVDEWGSVWHVGEPGVAGEVKEPIIGDWSALAAFQPPWSLFSDRDVNYVNETCAQSEKFMLSPVAAQPFERLQFLRGTQNVLVELACGLRELHHLLNIVHEFHLKEVLWWASTDVDGVILMDDWGSSRGLLINPEMWRSVFKPMYREYCDIIHKAGKFVFFHSDGHIESIFGDLVEVGVDALNSQLFCMNIEELAGKYKGRITFWGELDRQHILPFGTSLEVRESVLRVRKALDDGVGGVFAQCTWGQDAPMQNIEAAFEAWR